MEIYSESFMIDIFNAVLYYVRGGFKTQPAVPSGSGRLSLFRTIETRRNCRSTGGWVLKPSLKVHVS